MCMGKYCVNIYPYSSVGGRNRFLMSIFCRKLCILKHLRCFVSIYAYFCVKLLPQKFRSCNSVDKYHVCVKDTFIWIQFLLTYETTTWGEETLHWCLGLESRMITPAAPALSARTATCANRVCNFFWFSPWWRHLVIDHVVHCGGTLWVVGVHHKKGAREISIQAAIQHQPGDSWTYFWYRKGLSATWHPHK